MRHFDEIGKQNLLNRIRQLVAEAAESGIEFDEIAEALKASEGYNLSDSQGRNVHGFMVRG